MSLVDVHSSYQEGNYFKTMSEASRLARYHQNDLERFAFHEIEIANAEYASGMHHTSNQRLARIEAMQNGGAKTNGWRLRNGLLGLKIIIQAKNRFELAQRKVSDTRTEMIAVREMLRLSIESFRQDPEFPNQPVHIGTAYWRMGIINTYLGDPEAAGRNADRCLSDGLALDNAFLINLGHMDLALIPFARRDWDEAIRQCMRGLGYTSSYMAPKQQGELYWVRDLCETERRLEHSHARFIDIDPVRESNRLANEIFHGGAGKVAIPFVNQKLNNWLTWPGQIKRMSVN